MFFVNDTAPTEIYTHGHTLTLHDALPCWRRRTGRTLDHDHASGRRRPGVDPDREVRARTRRQRRGGAGERGRTRAAVVLLAALPAGRRLHRRGRGHRVALDYQCRLRRRDGAARSEEHTSELQSLMRISYAVFCLKKKT